MAPPRTLLPLLHRDPPSEGLNAFTAADISAVDAGILADYDVVVLGEMAISAAQATMFADWVDGGGNLIAMRPDADLAGLLGLADTGTDMSDAYLQIDTSPGSPVRASSGRRSSSMARLTDTR